ncbi:rano class II histocompatibility antigen, A beta chain-like isoform X2 [Engraulis encrasicolus]|uniref:rano class II histocompatibility antigen, A beta chain-like isoform X2 n=1 Tax=Engraulis encrasicolus TaxID=184585 RepID=UPI002FD450B8
MATLQYFVCALIILSLSLDGANGYYFASEDQCHFTSPDQYLEFTQTLWFNKAAFMRFNSTLGEWEGYTAFGVQIAALRNKDKAFQTRMRAEKERYCRRNTQIEIICILTQTAEPEVKLRLTKASSSGHPAMLVCSAYDFYPKRIKLTWYRDGKEVTGDMISSEELADGDWYYQAHSYLEFTPKAGENISCEVHHTSLKEPLVVHWDSSMPEPERSKIAIGAAGLVLGFVVTAAGFINYKRKSRERILVPSS